jgi:hypothetical protein
MMVPAYTRAHKICGGQRSHEVWRKTQPRGLGRDILEPRTTLYALLTFVARHSIAEVTIPSKLSAVIWCVQCFVIGARIFVVARFTMRMSWERLRRTMKDSEGGIEDSDLAGLRFSLY